jgi:hypothetical protein
MLAARKVVASARSAGVIAGLALAGLLGCVHQQAPSAPPVAAPLSPGPGASASPPPAVLTPAPPSPAASASPASGAAPPAPNPPPRTTAGATAPAPAPKRPQSAPAAPAAAGAAPTSIGAPAPAAAPGPPALDLASLEERLRDTHAIGVFTKLSLKNQVDDLLAQFRAFYAGRGALTLAELRRSYELLLMKVVTLLQDDDPGLAGAVSSSREAIWGILSDRNRFNNL